MKILYCGVMHGTSKSRFDGLKALGNEVKYFDYFEQSLTSKRWIQRLEKFKINHLNQIVVNTKLIKEIKTMMPKMLWVDKGTMILKETLKEIKKINKNIIIVHHCTDDVSFSSHNFKNYLESLNYYDAHFTCNKYNINDLEKISNSKFFYNELGYDHNIFQPSNDEKKYDLFFIGHHEPDYEKYISKVINLKLRFFIGGPGWHRSELPQSKISFTNYDEKIYQKVINQSKAGLGLYSAWNRNISSGRIFEIPACKVALIVKRNSFIEQLYVENRDAIFFDSTEELFEKMQFLINQPDELNLIAENGYKRCIQNKCSWKDRIYEAWQDLENAKII